MTKSNILRLDIMVFFCLFLASKSSFCQISTTKAKKNHWQHLNIATDSVHGINTDLAYRKLLKGHDWKTVIVAVIDNGTDTLHEDLKPVLWRNNKEKGRDEDHNGYINDRYGWNFLGEKRGNSPLRPGFESHRVYLSLKNKYGKYSDSEIINSGDKKGIVWLSAKDKFQSDSARTVSANLAYWKRIASEDSLWRKALGKEIYVARDLVGVTYPELIKEAVLFMPSFLAQDSSRTNQQQIARFEEAKLRLLKKYSQSPKLHRAETIGDDYDSLKDKFYGDPYVDSPTSDHGTHVAGIIGAVRGNRIGIDGIADKVRIMTIRAVPVDADEYDKDVALAIRYAVDNGAKVVNMSFGKPYSPEQKWVEEAIRYAAKKDVLLVHAAGNDAINTDSVAFYPTSKYFNGKYAPNMLTVGASSDMHSDLIAEFSNYGRNTVDVFAPGVGIYSTITGNKYASFNGTSMAAPVVSGLAALLRSNYPEFNAVQIKYIIEKSVTKIDFPVVMPGKKGKMVPMTELCRSGGIVNAYNAVLLAEKMSRRKN